MLYVPTEIQMINLITTAAFLSIISFGACDSISALNGELNTRDSYLMSSDDDTHRSSRYDR